MRKILLLFSVGFLVILGGIIVSKTIGAGQNSEIRSKGKGFFPNLVGIDLNGQKRILPDAFEGPLNLVVVAFVRGHQDAVNSWIQIFTKLKTSHPHLRFYEIPLIYEMESFRRLWINNGMRMGIQDPEAREQTITVYTDREKFTELTGLTTQKIDALIVDKNGKILWHREGASTNAREEDLLKILGPISKKE